MIRNSNQTTVGATETQGSWLKENVGKPFLWIAVGFVACKVLDAYTESKRTRRLTG